MLLSCSLSLPPNVFVLAKHWVAPLNPEDVTQVKSEMIDVTTHDEGWRHYIPGNLRVSLRDGTVREMTREEAAAAAAGGGDFWVVEPNPLHDQPLSFEEFVQECAQRDADDLLNWDYDDDWDSDWAEVEEYE